MKINKLIIFAFITFLSFISLPSSSSAEHLGCCQLSGGFCFDLEDQDAVDYCSSLPSAQNNPAGYCQKNGCQVSADKKIQPTDALQLYLNQPLPNQSRLLTISGNSLAQYLNVLYKFALGVVGLLALLMLTLGGLQWLFAGGNSSKVSSAKETILGAILGLVLALGAYTILNIINPKILSLKSLTIPKIPMKEIQVLSDSEFVAITGRHKLPAFGEAMTKKLLDVAKKINVHPCTFFAIVGAESAGEEGAIGHDEDVRNKDVGSRRSFVDTYKCQRQSGSFGSPCGIEEKVYNDDPGRKAKPVVTTDPDLGLDFRFSHGIGLTQTTIFPANQCSQTAGKHCYQTGSKEFTAKELISADKALEAAGLQWKSYYCKNSYIPTMDCYRRYVGVGTKWTEVTSQVKAGLFKQCQAMHPDWQ